MLENKVAVVTGGGTGIGRAIAIAFAQAGAKVVVNDYGVTVDGREPSSEPANEVVATIKAAGGEAIASAESVTDFAAGGRIVQTALDTWGKLDAVALCAGILRERMLFNMSEDEWDSVLAVHLKGHFNVMRHATHAMRLQRSGSIITFTSSAGLEGQPAQPNYSAAKAGIVGLTRSTALAMGRYDVRVNCIAPSAATRMTARLNEMTSKTRSSSERGLPEHVAPLAVFLASDQSAHITGQVVTATGNKIAIWSHPREIRAAFTEGAWSAERIADVWDAALGQDELARFKRMGLPKPGELKPAAQGAS